MIKLKTIVLFRSCFGMARLAEFEAVTNNRFPDLNIDWEWEHNCHLYYGGDYGPSIIQALPDVLAAEQWSDIGASCISVKAVFDVLGEGTHLQECIQQVGTISETDLLSLIQDPWAMRIKHMGKMKRLHPKERTQRIEMFRHVLEVLNHKTVSLENPITELWLLEDCRSLEVLDPGTERQKTQYCWLLIMIKPLVTCSASRLAEQSDVKKRSFIHTTTMSADRAILMSNLGKVSRGSSVLDPFCGSGGLLLSSALLGSKTVGSDIDVELIFHKDSPLPFPSSSSRPLRGVELVSYEDPFVELSVDSPTIVEIDILSPDAIDQYLSANQGHLYNAMVTDPPYGIRESQSQMGDLRICSRLCEIGSKVLHIKGRIVFLRLVKCTASTVKQVQINVELDIIRVILETKFEIVLISMERFNTRLWRATIVLQLSN